MKSLIICFDGLDTKMIIRNLHKCSFLKKGIMLRYESAYQETVPSWTSIYTGLRKRDHGFDSTWSSWLDNPGVLDSLPCVWQNINAENYTVGLYNLPLTYPPPNVNGWVLSGFPIPKFSEKCIYPRKMLKYLKHYKVDLYQEIIHLKSELAATMPLWDRTPKETTKILNMLESFARSRVFSAKSLYDVMPVDVLFIGFSFLDHAGHLGFTVEKLYSEGKINKIIESLIYHFNPENWLLVSDHGFVNHEEIIGREEDGKIGITRWNNHTKNSVLFSSSHRHDDEIRHEWDIKYDILQMLHETGDETTFWRTH